jgi:hypothetical protein
MINSLGYTLAMQIYHLHGTNATVPYVPILQFGSVVTRKTASLVQYRSYVPHSRCDDCEHWFSRTNLYPQISTLSTHPPKTLL